MKHLVLFLALLGLLPSCVSHQVRREESISAVVEVCGFIPFERRAWLKDHSAEYDFHRLDFRVLKPESHGRVISVLLPIEDWPEERFITPGRVFSIRLRAKDIAGASAPFFPEYRFAELQMSQEPNQAPEPTAPSGRGS
jgi:hypothetical protein